MTPFAPNAKFIDTHANLDIQRDNLAPDISIYPIAVTINHKEMRRPISPKWTSLSNLSSMIHLTHSIVSDFRMENDSDNAQLVRGQLSSYAAAQSCVSFTFIFSVFLCAKNMRGSFVGIVTARSLPSALTMSISPTSLTLLAL